MTDNPLSGKVGLDTTEFKAAISQMNRDIRVIESGFRASSAALGDWSKDASGLELRIKSLNSEMEVQRKKVDAVADEYKRVAAEKGETSRAAQELQIKLNRETETLGKMESQLKTAEGKLNEMGEESKEAAKAVDKLGKEEDQTTEKTHKFAGVMGGLGGALKAGGIAIAGITAAVAGLAAGMAKSVIDSFGELEQNLGGSEAVFGEYAASIQKTGEEAYKNLGVSQSDYLAIANKMGALFQGSGIEQVKSLELTEKAMQRAADMASVMGIDMQVALDSVAGAAKGNFTMMDNLGVAMNATNIEAYALAKGLDFTWASASNAEKAEVAMQMFFENTEQYAGNFAKESTQTISGSLGLFKAAYGSFLAGLGNEDADVGNQTDNLVDAFGSVVDNIVPVLGNIVSVLPTATNAILGAVSEMLPLLLETVTTLFSQVLETVVALLPELIPVAVDAIMTIVNALIQNLPMLMRAGIQLLLALINGILPQLPLLIKMALEMIVTLANGITEAIPQLLPVIAEMIPQIIITLVENLPLLIEAALQLIMAIVDGLIIALPILIEYTPDIIQAVFDALLAALPMIGDAAVEIVMALITGIGAMLPDIGTAAGEIITTLDEGILALYDSIYEMGSNIVIGIWNGIKEKGGWLMDNVRQFFQNIIQGSKDELEEESPSKVYKKIGKNMALGTGIGFVDEFTQVRDQITGALMGAINVHGGLVPAVGLSGSRGSQNITAAGGWQGDVIIQANVSSDMDVTLLARRVAKEIEKRRN
ncbi:MAG: phage tail protein [Anaerolineaceae bacterium]|nr:phage tail protein [Anaerolineaceae bacterium]